MTFRYTSVFLLGAAAALADQVLLKNGDRITGKIVKKEGGKLTVKGDLTGEVTIPWDAVTSVASDAALTVEMPDGKTISGKLATDAANVRVDTAQAPLKDLKAIRDAAQQKAYERLLHPTLRDLWAGYFDLGYAIARGNARTNTLTSAFAMARATNTDKLSLYFNQIRASATINRVAAETAEAIRGGWAYNRNANPRFFVNLFNDYEYDRFQNLDLRFVAGGGLGGMAIKNERTRLDFLGGMAYNREQFSTPLTRNSAEAYWGDELNFKLNGATTLRQSFRMFNNLSQTGVYRVNFDLGLSTAFRKWLSWQVTASDRFLSNPVTGRQRNDVVVTTGVRLSFAR